MSDFSKNLCLTVQPRNVDVRHYQPHIPTALIVVAAGEYPELRLKAWTSRVITAFLAVCLGDLCQRFDDAERPVQLALAAASCMKLSEWMLMMERYPRFLTQQQADHLCQLCWESSSCRLIHFAGVLISVESQSAQYPEKGKELLTERTGSWMCTKRWQTDVLLERSFTTPSSRNIMNLVQN